MKKQELLLIGGYMHSGTTLLHSVLASHNQVLKSYKETKILEWGSAWQFQYINAENKLDYIIRKILHSENIDSDFVPKGENVVQDLFLFLRHKANVGNYRYYLEGSPNSYLWLDKLPPEVDYKIILITRDPRDIIASVKKRITSNNFGKASRLKGKLSNYYSFILYTLSVKKSFKKIEELVKNENAFETDYFLITKSYSEVINDLAAFLNIDSSDFSEAKDVDVKNSAMINFKPEKSLYFSSHFNDTLSKREILVIEGLFLDYFKARPYLGVESREAWRFWFLLYCLRIPYDLVILFIARLIRFGSIRRFWSYLKTTLRRFTN